MKIKTFILSLTLNIFISLVPQKISAQEVSVSFQVFYDELSPYGIWVDNPSYGYVWVPSVDAGFTPYATNGYWVFTDEGWTWVSNYPWGWAPFHYGRWFIDPLYGPMWVPDNEWGPGWVTWRRSDEYYGWAPIGPGISIEVAYSDGYDVPYNQWTFVRGGDFGRTNINNYYVSSSNNVTIINNTKVINNIRVDKTRNVTYNQGPERTEVEKQVGKPITPIAIKENSKPGQSLNNGQLQIYRPQIQKISSTGSKPIPKNVTNLKDVKISSHKTTETPKQKTDQPTKGQPSQTQKKEQPQNSNQQKKSEDKKITQPLRQPQNSSPTNKQQSPQSQQNKQPKEIKVEKTPQNNNQQKQPVQPQQNKPTENNKGQNQPRPAPQPRQQQQQQQPQQQQKSPAQQNQQKEKHPH